MFDAFSRRLWGRRWKPKWGQHRAKIVPGRLPRRSWSRVAGRCGFLKLWGAFWAPPEPRKSCSRYNAGPISANLADRAGGSKIDPILVQNRGQMASGGVQMGLKAVSEKGAISVLIFNRTLMNFQTPRGGGFKLDTKTVFI